MPVLLSYHHSYQETMAVTHTHTHTPSALTRRHRAAAAAIQALARSSRGDLGKDVTLALAGRFRKRGKLCSLGSSKQETGKAVPPSQGVNYSCTFSHVHGFINGSSHQKHLDTQTGMYLAPLPEHEIHDRFKCCLGFETMTEKGGLCHRIFPSAFQMIHHKVHGNKLGTDFLPKWVGT